MRTYDEWKASNPADAEEVTEEEFEEEEAELAYERWKDDR